MNERKGKEGKEGWIGWGTVRAATMGDAFFLRLSVRFLVSIQVFSLSLSLRAECRFHSEMGSMDDHSQLCIFELPTV